jgi:small subunit ribosomal protein S18
MRFKERGIKKIKKKSAAFPLTRKRICRFCKEKINIIDYKDLKRLERFITERGKILSSRISGNCAKHQRVLARAIKKARFISLVPYTKV